jgi:hypothetical protein
MMHNFCNEHFLYAYAYAYAKGVGAQLDRESKLKRGENEIS